MKDHYYNWHICFTMRHLNGIARNGELTPQELTLREDIREWGRNNPNEVRHVLDDTNFLSLYPPIRRK